jgi:hypothetical protein
VRIHGHVEPDRLRGMYARFESVRVGGTYLEALGALVA